MPNRVRGEIAHIIPPSYTDCVHLDPAWPPGRYGDEIRQTHSSAGSAAVLCKVQKRLGEMRRRRARSAALLLAPVERREVNPEYFRSLGLGTPGFLQNCLNVAAL